MKYFVTFCCLVHITTLFAQSNNQYLQRYNAMNILMDSMMETRPDTVIILGNEQIKLARQLKNDSLIIEAKLKQAEALFNIGIYDESLKMRYDLLLQIEQNPHDERLGELLLNIAFVHFELQDFNRYLEFAQKAKIKFLQHKQYDDTLRANTEIGLAHMQLGHQSQAIQILKQTMELSKRTLTDSFQLMLAIDNLSLAYTTMGDHQNALKYQLEMEAYRFHPFPIYYQIASDEHLAEKYIGVKDYHQAQIYMSKAIDSCKKYKNYDWLFLCYLNQSVIYEKTNKPVLALKFFQQAIEIKDSIYQKNYASKMSVMANMYELNHKQNEIENLSKDKELSQTNIQRLSLAIFALILTFTLIGVIVLYRKNKHEKSLKEQFAQQLLNSQEEERQRIAKDLHDSVGQNILFIRNQLQLKDRDDTQLLKSIDLALEEVRTISKNLYPNQLEKYGLTSAVDALIDQVKSSTGIFVSSDLQGIDEALSKNVQINFYRIIQEFVNNTIKHANATAIRITAEHTEHHIKLIVQDNGKGFDKMKLERSASSSFGLINMEERIKMLKGTFELETEKGQGTKSTFTIPI